MPDFSGILCLGGNEIMRKYVKFFVLALVLELSLFNYKYYLTMGNEEYIPEYSTGDGLLPVGNGLYLTAEEGEYTIRLTGIGRKVNALCLDIGYRTEESYQSGGAQDIVSAYEKQKIYVRIEAQDESNELGLTLGNRDIVHEVEQTAYMRLHLSGKTDWINCRLTAEPGETIQIYKLSVNPRIPFYFSLIRVLAVGGLLSLLCLLRPGSSAYAVVYQKSPLQGLAVWCCVLAEILLFARLVMMNPYFVYPVWRHHNQYYELAEAFHEGQLSLTEEVPDFLKEMENPYDKTLRSAKAAEAGESVLWDHAYYNGQYYVYFGVVPELLFYYPYYELFGEEGENEEFEGGRLEHFKIIFFCAAAEVIAVYLLLGEIIRLWYQRTPFVLYLLLSACFSMGCGILTILLRPDFYSVPIICGLVFSLYGLYFWLSAKRERLILWRLAAGSLCMALVAGCRPQMLILSFLALPLFWEERKDTRMSGEGWKSVSSLLLPYIPVAAGLMIYNAARFGSPFDFGANYNLTTNDMTGRGWELGRMGLGFFSYLFQPVNLEAEFPFIVQSSFASSYLGMTVREGTYGGVFAANLILLPLLLLPWCRKYFKSKTAFRMSAVALAGAVLVVAADTQMAGILPRYYNDFTWMLYLAVCPLLLSLYEFCLDCEERLSMRLYRHFLMAACASGIAYHVLRIYAGSASALVLGNPAEFYRAAQTIAFWR